ncbi:MAG: hypothetical protein D6731_09305 [Planctomycetota bacterium]|nr:MAG: hypothetical protein D6731_09305 [Planctomycetota bacterium]
MAERRKRLLETARALRSRLRELERSEVPEFERPMREVALRALRGELSEVGRELQRLAVC